MGVEHGTGDKSTLAPEIPKEFAISVGRSDGTSDIIDARFGEERVNAINAELVRRGLRPTVTEITAEQVAKINELKPLHKPPKWVRAAGALVYSVLHLGRSTARDNNGNLV